MKKLLLILLACAMLLSGLTVMAEQADGLILMPDTPTDASLFEFDAASGEIRGYWGSDTDVVIPREIDGAAVRKIRGNAFDRCRDYTDTDVITNSTEWVHLRSVTVPETVEVIEDSAFSYCQQLERFVCYAHLASTGKATFSLCRNLNTVLYVNGVDVLDNYLFDNCDSLETVYYGAKAQQIGTQVFSFCGIRSLYLNADEIANWAVRNCPELTEVHLGGDIVNAQSGAIATCPKLTDVWFEGGLFNMGDGLTGETASEMTVYVPEGTSEEDKATAQKKTCLWSMTPPAVTVTEQNCPQDHASVPGMEIAAQAAPEPDSADACLGMWYGETMTTDGTPVSLADLGMEVRVNILSDGTAELYSGEEEAPEIVSWTSADGVLTMDRMEAALSQDGKLFLRDEGVELVLVREQAEQPAAATEPEPAAAEPEPTATEPDASAAEPYLGVWNGETMTVYGLNISLADTGAEMKLTLNADGSAELFNGQSGETTYPVWTMAGGTVTVNGQPVNITEAGKLVLSVDGVDVTFGRQEESASEPDFLGDWYCQSVVQDGFTSNMADLELVCVLTLGDDGAAELRSDDDSPETFIWTYENGTLFIDGEPVEWNEDGTFYLTSAGIGMTFGREAPVVSQPEPVGAEGEPFVGVWYVQEYYAGDESVDLAAEAIEVKLTLNEDGVYELESTLTEESTVAAWKMDNGVPCLGAVPMEVTEDGRLYLEDSDGSVMIFGRTSPLQHPAPVADPVQGVDTAFVGVWYGNTAVMGGVEYPTADLGMSLTLTLNEDGSATGEVMGETVEGTWSMTDAGVSVDIDGSEQIFAVEGENLTADMSDGVTLVLSREAAEATPAAEPIPAMSAAQFDGSWNAVQVEAFDMKMPFEAVADELSMMLGIKGVGLKVENGAVQWEGQAEARQFELTDGMLQYASDSEFAETVQLLSDGRIAYSALGITVYCEKGEGEPVYPGTWYGIYLKTGGAEGNPRTMWNLEITLQLNEDGTGTLDYAGPDAGMVWYQDETSGQYYYGTPREGDPDTPLCFTKEGYLLYGTPLSGYIIFSRNPEDEVTDLPQEADFLPKATAKPTVAPTAEPTPEPTPVPTAEPTPEPTANPYLETRFVCTKANAGGYEMQASMLGGTYSVIFHTNGTADFEMLGTKVPNLAWKQEGDRFALDYYGNTLYFDIVEEGLEMDYFGSMKMTFEAE